MNAGIVNIGIIGCGWIAEHAHIPALLKNDKVNMKAVFDTDIERAHNISSEFSIQYAFNKLEDFLDCGLDGVIIATPNFTHVKYSLEALNRGIGVLCEKPVALKASEVEEIIKVAKENHAIYIPGFVNRWRQDIQTIYHAIVDGTLGDIKAIDAGWIRKFGVPRPGTWFTNREFAGGGVLTDLGSHILDICLLFLGDKKLLDYKLITSICNYEKMNQSGAAGWFNSNDTNTFDIDVEDTVIAHVKFENDVNLNVKLSWLAPIDADYTYFKVNGTKGKMELKTLFGFSNERLWKEDTLYCEIDGVEKTVHLDMAENNTRNAFSEMLYYFTNSLLSRKTDFTDSNDALKTVALIEKLYQSEVQDENSVRMSLSEVI